MFSDLTAQAILDRHKKVSSVKEEEQKPPTFSTGIRIVSDAVVVKTKKLF